jgi:type IX secretion system PorP/SprF family membrane protein
MGAAKKILALMLLLSQICFGQIDVHFSQFYETSILRNPGLTGVFADDYKLSGFYRNQWSSVSVPYNTYLFNGETKVPLGTYVDDFVSFGLLSYSDRAGTAGQKITGAYPTISYNKSVNPDLNSYFSFGVCGMYSQYSFDPGRVTFNSQYQNGVINTSLSTMENFSGNKVSFWNLGAGLNFNSSTNQDNNVVYCFGISGYNLTEQPISYLRSGNTVLNFRTNVNAALAIALREDIQIQFHSNYVRQGDFSEISGAFLWSWSKVDRSNASDFSLILGGIFRYNDGIAPLVKLKYQRLSVSASYDINTSTFRPATNMQGGVELSVSLSGNYNRRMNSNKATVCPRF